MAEKVEVRFLIDQEFMKQLQDKLGSEKTTELAKTAFTVLNWAADEAKAGRFILSSAPDGSEVHRLAVPGVPNLSPSSAKLVDMASRKALA